MERREAEKSEKSWAGAARFCSSSLLPCIVASSSFRIGEILFFRYSEPKIVTLFFHLQCMIPMI